MLKFNKLTLFVAVALLFVGNISSSYGEELKSVEDALNCAERSMSLQDLDRSNSEDLVCFYLKAEKDINYLLKHKIMCDGAGYEEIGEVINFAPIFDMSLVRTEKDKHGIIYHLKINGINEKVLQRHRSSTVATQSSEGIKYISNGKSFNFTSYKNEITTIVGAGMPPGETKKYCIWVD